MTTSAPYQSPVWEEGCAFWNRRGRSAARICRSFLTLPKLEQLVWLNHSHHWFDAFSRRMVSGKQWMLCCFASQLEPFSDTLLILFAHTLQDRLSSYAPIPHL